MAQNSDTRFEGTSTYVATEDLLNLRNQLTTFYILNGYVNSGATIPDQEVVDGVIEISITEGTLAQVEVQGVTHFRPPRELLRADRSLDRFAGEVEHRDLERRVGIVRPVVESVHEHEHAVVGDLGNIDLRRGGDAVPAPQVDDLRQARGERLLVGELRRKRAVQRPPARHARRRPSWHRVPVP